MNEKESIGHLHPITQVTRDVYTVFSKLGFQIASGPEIETDYYNFTALNFPLNHPARDMQDTFWVKSDGEKKLLRTQTSPIQVRFMEKQKPPIRVVAPGKVFRYEATDATHEAQFYQVEGLMVDKDISIGHLKGVLVEFFNQFFGKKTDIRFRPSFFPFVEPGVEVDLSCFKCGGEVGRECRVCKGTSWIEVLGAGMVHPNVLSSVGIDSNVYQGFAFGAGIDRLAMIKYGIDDIRLLYSGDLRLVNQF